jgi:hypothetical protein
MLLCLLAATALPSLAQSDPSGTQTLRALQEAVVPARDRADLARRLLGVTAIPAPPTTPPVFKVGDQKAFNVVNLDTNEPFTVQTALLYETAHSYWWFEVGYAADLARVQQAAETFETVIYPTVRRYFGSEASPGIDGDVRLYIVHARKLGRGVAGYFEGDSELSRLVVPRSNEHQMFFINLDAFGPSSIGNRDYLITLAHEFQHMIHANADGNETVWLDEGLAELAAALALEGFDRSSAGAFLNRPDTQLNTWPQLQSSIPHYGGSYLFAAYFLHRFGEDALRDLVSDPRDGLASLTSTLQRRKLTDPATRAQLAVEDLFTDWVVANVIPATADPRFLYPATMPLPRRAKTSPLTADKPQALALTQWGTTYLTVNTPGRYTLRAEGEPLVRVLPTNAASGRYFWWSNRGDQFDTRLTRAFDLTGISAATLRFKTWFAIEADWDFGYVMVSTDNGTTWTPLPLLAGTPGAEGNNYYGSAYTGLSGAANATDNAADARWIEQQIDLTAYAGKAILVRFEYITDEAISEPGFAIDDISIPELSFSDDAESDGGWTADGWVRIDNNLPQRLLIQQISPGTTMEVTRLLLPEDGAVVGEWEIEVKESTAPLILTFSGMTEYTTELAALTVTLTRR